MKIAHRQSWMAASFTLALGFGVLALGASGCDSPEGFCEGWVADQCEVLAGCCKNGAKYDLGQCVVDLSAQCQQVTAVEFVHAGYVEFHPGEASTCLGTIDSCDQADASAEEAFERQIACANMLTGFRPQGAACEDDVQCESNGDFGTCWQGLSGNQGVCAATIVSSDGACGFSVETNELTTCGVEQFCDTSEFIPDPNATPAVQGFEFKGKCKPFLGAGGSCADATGTHPCKEGLYCDLAGGVGTCAAQKGEGEACSGMSNECKSPLVCDSVNGQNLCAKSDASGPFCFIPPVCGDGTCDFATEQTSCPQDCNTQAECGDGVCDFNGTEPALCPADCCNDGFCDAGEEQVCPQDCGAID